MESVVGDRRRPPSSCLGTKRIAPGSRESGGQRLPLFNCSPPYPPHILAGMATIQPDEPRFDVAVYGTIFGDRRITVQRLDVGDRLILVPDPAGVEDPSVWVHATGGDVVGHLSPDVNRWLVPRMLAGGRYSAAVKSVGGEATESWTRLVITITRR